MQVLAAAHLGYVALLCNTGHVCKVINNDDKKTHLFFWINELKVGLLCWIVL